MRLLIAAAFVATCFAMASAKPVASEVHLAMTQVPNQLRVTWTAFPPAGKEREPATVLYGLSESGLPAKAQSSVDYYTIDQMCGSPANDSKAWVDPGVMHTALLSNLPSSGSFYYQIVDATGRVSQLYKAYSGVRNPSVYSFAAFGDMGLETESKNNMKILQNWLPDINLAVHVGDISYARGRNNVWADFMNMIEPVASAVPWMVNCGNHDCLDPNQEFQPPWLGYMWAGGDGGECGKAYNARFFMPGQSEPSMPAGGKNNVYFSFEHGPVHFSLLSSEHDMREGSAQYKWLVKDLASVNRTRTPWVFFGLHRPLYDVTVCGALLPETAEMRKILEPVLLRYRVDVVMHGHYHQYERTCPLAAEKCVNPAQGEPGPTYVTIGTAGKRTQCQWGIVPPWSKVLTYDYGVMKFDIHNRTHLTGYFHESTQGRLVDEFTVVRKDNLTSSDFKWM